MILKKPVLTFVFLLIGLLSLSAQQISLSLQEELETSAGQPLTIYLLLKDRVDASAMEAEFERRAVPLAQRAPQLIKALQAKAAATQPALLQRLHRIPGIEPSSIAPYWITNVIFLKASPDAIRQLASDPAIAFIDEDFLLEPVGLAGTQGPVLPPAPGSREVGLTAINAPALWKMGYTGYGRKAMIIDTGEDLDHPAIRNQFLGQTVPVSHAWSGSGKPGPCLSGNFNVASHGTHVTGTVVGLDRLNQDTIGVAFNGQWMAGGVSLSGCQGYENGSAQSIVSNFQWALNPDGNPNTSSDIPDVINNSWGRSNPPQNNCDGNNSISQDLINAHFAAGTALVFSAGNDGPNDQTHVAPAFISMDTVKVFSVGAVHGDIWGHPIADFSSRGPTTCDLPEGPLKIKPEVVAPGVAVRSAVVGGGYQQFNGTSMAGPHAAGAVLLLREAFPQLAGEEILKALYYSAKDLGAEGEDNVYGRGMIDVEQAYNYLLDKGFEPTPPTASQRDLILLDVPQSPVQCDGNYQPYFILENGGTETVSSFELELSFDGDLTFTETWNFNQTLLPGERLTLQLPDELLLPSGKYQVTVALNMPNVQPDDRPLNNRLKFPLEVFEESGYNVELTPQEAVCAEGSALLRYLDAGPEREMRWYDHPLQGKLLGSGDLLLTPKLNEQQLIWGQLIRKEDAGLPLPGNLGSADTAFAAEGGLRFDALSTFTLESVTLYAQEQTGALILLRDAEDKLVKSIPAGLQPGPNVVKLELEIPAGENYLLTLAKGNKPLLQLDGFQNYPFELPGFVRITGSEHPVAPVLTYPFFFDWVISHPDLCGRQPLLVEVAQDTAPVADFQVLSVENAPDGQLQLSLEAEEAGISSWEWKIEELSLAAQGSQPNFTLPAPGAYRIWLTVQSEAGCVHSTTQIVEVEQVTSARQPEQTAVEASIFPNPNRGVFSIQLAAEASGQPATLTLFDPLGRPTHYQHLRRAGNRLEVNAGEVPGGLYTIRIQLGDKLIVRKVVIE